MHLKTPKISSLERDNDGGTMKRQMAEVALFVLGAGGHGGEVLSYIRELKGGGASVRLVGVVDEQRNPGPWRDAQVLGNIEWLCQFLKKHPDQNFYYLAAYGSNSVRHAVVARL